ncbi:hypothetical protein [Cytobacillus purgationiresistens]|uniref:Uncharacterized protein n=1 Tax=Cytobacillus purgationiresistens TaxID=863449 RepID=A0ABU0AJG3_9BACI|nr:hypothetical protein [Cytobacillus purgationiresistens]MDQ0271406.1 hypothetical protein [Cytobacillus purgationiresistens]
MDQSINLLKLILICSVAGVVIRLYEMSHSTSPILSIHNIDIFILFGLIFISGKGIFKPKPRS